LENEQANDHPNVAVMPPLLITATLGLALALEQLSNIQFLLPLELIVHQTGIGGVLVMAGMAIAALGGTEFVKKGTNISPHMPSLKLVRTGVYKFTRNPIYIGMLLFQLGISLFLALEWGVLLTGLSATVLHFGVVLREEAYLREKFGKPYEEYLESSKRWL